MRKLILLAIIILATSYTFAQNNLNPKRIDGFNFSSTFVDKNYFNNNFIRGWNWSQSDLFSHKLDKSLNINTYHYTMWWQDLHTPTYSMNTSAITPLARTHTSYKGLFNCTGLGIYLEPALQINTTSAFLPNAEADYGAVFGFQSKSGGKENVLLVMLSGTQSFSDRFFNVLVCNFMQ